MNLQTYKEILSTKTKTYVKVKVKRASHWFLRKKPSKFEGQVALVVGGTNKGTDSKIRLELVKTGQRFSTSYRNVEILDQLELAW